MKLRHTLCGQVLRDWELNLGVDVLRRDGDDLNNTACLGQVNCLMAILDVGILWI